MSNVTKKVLNEEEVFKIARALRRMNRKSRELMEVLGVSDEDVRIPRKKRRPAAAKKVDAKARKGEPEAEAETPAEAA